MLTNYDTYQRNQMSINVTKIQTLALVIARRHF